VSRTLCRHWWAVGLRGVLAIAFGTVALAMPRPPLTALVALFGVYALADGVVTVWLSRRGRHRVQEWRHSLEGLVGSAAGVAALLWPDITSPALLLLIALRTILAGAMWVAIAIRLRRAIEDELLLITGGVLSICFGAVLIAFLGVGALALAWLIGVYAIVAGTLLVVLAFRLRGLGAGRRRVAD
jgi:uncharacterized membrane protein HdeD (DUF308 family)